MTMRLVAIGISALVVCAAMTVAGFVQEPAPGEATPEPTIDQIRATIKQAIDEDPDILSDTLHLSAGEQTLYFEFYPNQALIRSDRLRIVAWPLLCAEAIARSDSIPNKDALQPCLAELESIAKQALDLGAGGGAKPKGPDWIIIRKGGVPFEGRIRARVDACLVKGFNDYAKSIGRRSAVKDLSQPVRIRDGMSARQMTIVSVESRPPGASIRYISVLEYKLQALSNRQERLEVWTQYAQAIPLSGAFYFDLRWPDNNHFRSAMIRPSGRMMMVALP